MSKVALILNLLASSAMQQEWWGVREIAKSLGISPSTAHRTLSAMSDIGYVCQDPTTSRY